MVRVLVKRGSPAELALEREKLTTFLKFSSILHIHGVRMGKGRRNALRWVLITRESSSLCGTNKCIKIRLRGNESIR